MSIQFIPLGGAHSIGSSCYLLKIDEIKILVDCGLKISDLTVENNTIINLQKEIGHLRNLNAVFVTHAHLDHIGALPILVANGYNGMFYGTSITKELTYISLSDYYYKYYYKYNSNAFRIQKRNIDYIRAFWESIEFGVKKSLYNFQVTPLISGHLIGGCSYLFESGKKTIIFSGDLSLNSLSQMNYPGIPKCDYFICDGTGLNINGKTPENKQQKKELVSLLKSPKPILIKNYVLGKDIFYLLKIKELIKKYDLNKQIVVNSYTEKLLSIYEKYYPMNFSSINISDRISYKPDTVWIGNYNMNSDSVNNIDRFIHYRNHLNQVQLLFFIKEILKPTETFFVHTNSTDIPDRFPNCKFVYENLNYTLEG